MSGLNAAVPSDPIRRGPTRTISTSRDYSDAERKVDWLSDQGFPVERISIVGTGLRYVEQVAGRVTTGRAALLGARTGAMFGLFFGVIFALLFTTTTGSYFGVLAYSVASGAVFYAVFAAFGHYAQRGRRDFGSVATTQADHYELQVDAAVADDAERLLGGMPAAA
jgi:hypothetical protein